MLQTHLKIVKLGEYHLLFLLHYRKRNTAGKLHSPNMMHKGKLFLYQKAWSFGRHSWSSTPSNRVQDRWAHCRSSSINEVHPGAEMEGQDSSLRCST